MNDKTSFGAEPEGMDRLLAMGLDESDEDTSVAASWGHFLEKPGGRIGRYKLLKVLGEGGMGIVYLAEQTQPMKRKVALKVIKPGMDSKRVIARFEAERQALALLDHPNIAHVYDAGTTQSGRPYFVMEFVEGLPITGHCDRYKLTIDERLKLFVQVCHAVHHAHQKGIIHRDIKPSNIVVSTVDDKPILKIIDFGVAKALSQPLTERTLITEQGRLFGTPEYMSPEQADMAGDDIDTRSDIYSLGVLLYVLLTGVLPFDSKTLRDSGIENIRKVIRETNPKTPSTRLTKLGEEAKKVAENRHTDVAALTRCLHKELEWIPQKAMRKERTERYRSAAELADDIDNYLQGKPLIAGPPSVIYRANKFVRRHKALVTGISAVLMVLIAGIIVSTVFAVRAERNRAEAQALVDFLLKDVFGTFDDAGLSDISSDDLFNSMAKKLEGRSDLGIEPLHEASIHYAIGMIYRTLSELTKAERHFEHAYEIRWEHLDPGDRQMITTMRMLAYIYGQLGKSKEAEKLYRQVLEIGEREHGDRYFWIWVGENLGANLYIQGRYEESEQQLLEIVKVAQQRLGPNHIRTLGCKGRLAFVYALQGRYEKANKLHDEVYATMQQVLDHDHQILLTTKTGAGVICLLQGDYLRAYPLLTQSLEGRRKKLGPDHRATLDSVSWLATLYTKQGNHDDANDLFTETLKGQELKLGRDHPDTLRTINGLGILRREQGNYQDANDLLTETLEGRQKKLGADHPHTLETVHELAVLYIRQACYEKAQEYLLKAVNGRIEKLKLQHPHTQDSIRQLIELYDAWNKPDQADHWRAKLAK